MIPMRMKQARRAILSSGQTFNHGYGGGVKAAANKEIKQGDNMSKKLIKKRASKRCEDCFNEGVVSTLNYVINQIDYQLGYLSDAPDISDPLERLRTHFSNDIEIWENSK